MLARMQKRLAELKRLRWIVLGVVAVGIAVSVAINVLHAQDHIVARLLSAWPPLALFGAIELISRIPTSGRALSAGRIIGALIVGGVGLAVSYSHMKGEVEKYEGAWQALIWPASVDGLMIVAGLSLIEVVRKIRAMEDAIAEDLERAERAAAAPPAVAAPVQVQAAKPSRQRGTGRSRATGAGTRVSEAKRREVAARDTQSAMTTTEVATADKALTVVGSDHDG